MQLRRVRCAMPRWKTGCTLPPGLMDNSRMPRVMHLRALCHYTGPAAPQGVSQNFRLDEPCSVQCCASGNTPRSHPPHPSNELKSTRKRGVPAWTGSARGLYRFFGPQIVSPPWSAHAWTSRCANLMPRDPPAGQQTRTPQPAQSNCHRCARWPWASGSAQRVQHAGGGGVADSPRQLARRGALGRTDRGGVALPHPLRQTAKTWGFYRERDAVSRPVAPSLAPPAAEMQGVVTEDTRWEGSRCCLQNRRQLFEFEPN